MAEVVTIKNTDVEKFHRFLKKKGFERIDKGHCGTYHMTPHHRVDKEGTHTLISSAWYSLFSGVDTPEGKLGCVTFYYSGPHRAKNRKRSHVAEILKSVSCPKTLEEAKAEFDKWNKETGETIKGWKVII